MSDFIKRLTVKNYGCLQDVNVELTPLHAFVGPNDSGKSTLLRAVRTALQFAGGTFGGYDGPPFNPGIDLSEEGLLFEVSYRDGPGYRLSINKGGVVETVFNREREIRSENRGSWSDEGLLTAFKNEPLVNIPRKRLAGTARLLRLDPDALREPSGLIREGQPVDFMNERGLGLPSVYDVIINRDAEGFVGILTKVRELFPWVRKLGLRNINKSSKSMEMTLADGRRVSAEFMSEGLLYYLAIAAIPFLASTPVILIEEPENGLHPARITEVMRVLREVSKTTQILIATHSPLVINEMKPEEVSVVTRPPEKGTQVTRIDRTPDFEDRAKVYALGELWLSYADGEYESPLLDGGPRP